MRPSDANILVVPGHGGLDEEHWQSRWINGLTSARLVEQDDWLRPDAAAWRDTLLAAIAETPPPIVLVGHGLGVVTIAGAAEQLGEEDVAAGFLVAVPDVDDPKMARRVGADFAPMPRGPLPFPSLLIASRTDTDCAYAVAEDLSYAWGSRLVDAGDAGKLDPASGHGPWPEGLMTFGQFLARL
jgi:hypothetical protein